MGPVVAVEIAPAAQAASPGTAVLLDACSRAVTQGSCVAAEHGLDRSALGAVATVSWRSTEQVSVQVGLPGRAETDWLSRDLTFTERDAPNERWRAVGLTIATLVGELVGHEPDTAAVVAPKVADVPPKAAIRSRRPPEAVSHLRADGALGRRRYLGIEAGGQVGWGIPEGPGRIGPYAQLAYTLLELPIFVHTSFSYTVRASSAEPVLTWMRLGLGGGAFVTYESARLELAASGFLEQITASARHPVTGVEDSGARWLPGISMDVRGVWPASGQVSLVIGTEASLRLRPLRISNAGREVAQMSVLSGAILTGLRLNWPP